ncbi:MAG: glycosyltransferase family 39 protein [Planctomycetaceae bacterium]|nr:glycosyltransferase family 39 protein [Planctomycetaceae bacterium]
MKRMHASVKASLAVGAMLAALALIPTAEFAATFAHPQRVDRLDGAIPEATMRGALWLRLALVAAAVAIPALVFAIARALGPAGGSGSVPRERASRGELLFLAAIAAIGLGLRAALASESLWYDEISALVSFALEGPGVAFGSYAVPTNHVPMTLAMWAMTASTGGVGEWTLRFPAIVAGVIAIPVAWALAREVAPPAWAARAGICAALVVAIAPIPVIESAEARGYAFVIASSLVAALALARLARTRAIGDAVLLAVSCAFAAWSHPVALVLPAAIGATGLARLVPVRRDGTAEDRDPGRTLNLATILAMLLAAAIASPLLAPLVADALAHRGDYLRSTAEQAGLVSREGIESLTGLSLSWSLGLPTAPWAPLATMLPEFILPPIVLVALLVAGAWRIARDPSLAPARAVALPFLLAFALALLLTAAAGTWLYARFFLFALPASILAVAFALAAPAKRRTRILLVVALAFQCAIALPIYWRKQPIRDAVDAVAAMRADGDIVLTIGLPDNAAGFYAALSGFEAVPSGFLGADFERVVASAPRPPRFVVVLYPDRIDATVLAALDARFDRTHRFEGWADWGQGAVEVWRETTPAPPPSK